MIFEVKVGGWKDNGYATRVTLDGDPDREVWVFLHEKDAIRFEAGELEGSAFAEATAKQVRIKDLRMV